MAAISVAVLAELRHFAYQHCPVIAAMHIVADKTVLGNRGMLHSERPPLLGMTGIAEFINAVCLYHLIAEPAVRIMAISAFHLPFLNRMVRLPVGHHPYVLMAVEAKVRLGSLQAIFTASMEGVTVSAGDSSCLVLSVVPEGKVP
jgi:hypothetical protein